MFSKNKSNRKINRKLNRKINRKSNRKLNRKSKKKRGGSNGLVDKIQITLGLLMKSILLTKKYQIIESIEYITKENIIFLKDIIDGVYDTSIDSKLVLKTVKDINENFPDELNLYCLQQKILLGLVKEITAEQAISFCFAEQPEISINVNTGGLYDIISIKQPSKENTKNVIDNLRDIHDNDNELGEVDDNDDDDDDDEVDEDDDDDAGLSAGLSIDTGPSELNKWKKLLLVVSTTNKLQRVFKLLKAKKECLKNIIMKIFAEKIVANPTLKTKIEDYIEDKFIEIEQKGDISGLIEYLQTEYNSIEATNPILKGGSSTKSDSSSSQPGAYSPGDIDGEGIVVIAIFAVALSTIILTGYKIYQLKKKQIIKKKLIELSNGNTLIKIDELQSLLKEYINRLTFSNRAYFKFFSRGKEERNEKLDEFFKLLQFDIPKVTNLTIDQQIRPFIKKKCKNKKRSCLYKQIKIHRFKDKKIIIEAVNIFNKQLNNKFNVIYELDFTSSWFGRFRGESNVHRSGFSYRKLK